METFTFNTVELILLSAAGILFIIQLIYYFGLYNRIHAHNKAVRKEAAASGLFMVLVCGGASIARLSPYYICLPSEPLQYVLAAFGRNIRTCSSQFLTRVRECLCLRAHTPISLRSFAFLSLKVL